MSANPEYDLFAEFYDHVAIYRDRPDVGFYVEEALAAGGPVLEMGCGTGRVLIPCARAGATMTGIDRSPGMLEVCRRRLADEPGDVRDRVTLHVGDMRTVNLSQRFALITLPFRAFQHLETADDQRTTLAALRRHLEPGGRLILDLFNPSLPMLGDPNWLREPVAEPPVVLDDGRRMIRSLRIVWRDYLTQVQEVEIAHEVTWPDGRVERHAGTTRLRYTFRYEAEHLLAREGFAIEAVYADYERRPYGSTYPGDLVFVARLA